MRVPSLKEALQSEDPTWDEVVGVIWKVAECATGIICANLPVMRPLLHVTSQSRKSSSQGLSYWSTSRNIKNWQNVLETESDAVPINGNSTRIELQRFRDDSSTG